MPSWRPVTRSSTTLEIVPRGPFSLRAAAQFGFGGSLGAPQFDGAMRLAFAVDGFAGHAGVLLRECSDGTIEGEVQGGCDIEAVRDQVARILSLDHDGTAWVEVGERDPVIGRLQREHPGVRPVLFHSPYEAAAWSIVSARRPATQAAGVRRHLSEKLGVTFDVGGMALAAVSDLGDGPAARRRGRRAAPLSGGPTRSRRRRACARARPPTRPGRHTAPSGRRSRRAGHRAAPA